MEHRLDNKLVAVGALDILKDHVDSAYFFYDPEWKWLNLGVVGALREIEFLRKFRLKYGKQKWRWYVLGDLVISNPKVNYKL